MQREEWYTLIGNIMVSFAEIEWITYRLWDNLAMETEPPQEFKSRVDKLIGRLKKVEPGNERIQDTLIQSKVLYDKRNILAHNPLRLAINENDLKDGSSPGFDKIQYFVPSEKSKNVLSSSEVSKIMERIDIVEQLLWEQVDLFSGERNYK